MLDLSRSNLFWLYCLQTSKEILPNIHSHRLGLFFYCKMPRPWTKAFRHFSFVCTYLTVYLLNYDPWARLDFIEGSSLVLKYLPLQRFWNTKAFFRRICYLSKEGLIKINPCATLGWGQPFDIAYRKIRASYSVSHRKMDTKSKHMRLKWIMCFPRKCFF